MTEQAIARSQQSPSASPKAELLSKLAATGVVTTYALGFLITSLSHARYGIIQTNPFRPRILSAGAWFIALALPSIWIIVVFVSKNQRLTAGKFARILFPFWIISTLQTSFVVLLFTFVDTPIDIKWWRVIALILCAAFFTVPLKAIQEPKIKGVISVAFTSFFLISVTRDLVVHHKLSYGAITVWFFLIGVMAMMEISNQDPPKFEDPRWIKTFFAGLVILWLFASFIYPNIKASWGGGAQIPVTIYFSKDTTFAPTSSVKALLIDEADAGFYVIGQNDKKALFIPRTSVSLISFSDTPNDSELLKHFEPRRMAQP